MSRETARYTYTEGSRAGGVVAYDDDTKIHVHNDTCIARGQHSAFDLVRLHRFGHMDKDTPPETPITERPSHKAMCEFAAELPEIRAARAGAEFEDLGPLPVAEVPIGRFEFIPAGEYASGPPMPEIIAGVLPQAELAVIYGASSSGKTFFAIDLCKAITQGGQWNGRAVKVAGRVAYVCAEGAHGMKSRVRAGGCSDDLRLTSDAPNLMDEKDAAAIAQSMVRTGPYVAVVIDTLTRSHQGNENSGEDMGKVLKHCQFIHKATGALVVWVHHCGKDETRGQRGWSGLRAAADVEIEITRRGDYRHWSTAKMKDGADDMRGTFKLKRVAWDTDDGEVSSCVVEHVAGIVRGTDLQPKGANQIAAYEAVKSGITKFYDAITAALKQRGVKTADMDKEQRRRMRNAFIEIKDKKLITLDVESDTCGMAKLEDWLQ